jgi:hypothetical protein
MRGRTESRDWEVVKNDGMTQFHPRVHPDKTGLNAARGEAEVEQKDGDEWRSTRRRIAKNAWYVNSFFGYHSNRFVKC